MHAKVFRSEVYWSLKFILKFVKKNEMDWHRIKQTEQNVNNCRNESSIKFCLCLENFSSRFLKSNPDARRHQRHVEVQRENDSEVSILYPPSGMMAE